MIRPAHLAVTAGLLIAGLPLTALPQTPRTPPGLTPLGPVQAPRPSAPTQAPVVQGQDPLAPIQSQPLPSLTAPDAAFVTQPAPTAAPTQATRPATPPGPVTPIAGDWQNRANVELRGLVKVTARSATVTGKVGETLRFGTLSIFVRGCVARAPDQPTDAAAYLEITDRGATAPMFRGWMVASSPATAILEHPVYDIRIAACRP